MIVENQSAEMSCPFREAVTSCQGAKCMAWEWVDAVMEERYVPGSTLDNPPPGKGWSGEERWIWELQISGENQKKVMGVTWSRPHPRRRGKCVLLESKS